MHNLATKNRAAKAMSILCYPVIFLIVSAISLLAITEKLELGITTFFTVLFVIFYFVVMERINPFRHSWHPSKKEWQRDGRYFILVMIYGAIGAGIIRTISIYLAPQENALTLSQNVFLAILVSSFTGYWLHRLQHKYLSLWSFHGIHHTPNKVTTSNNVVVHLFEVIISAVTIQLIFLLLGFSAESVFIAGQFTVLQGYFIHANINVKMGWLNHLIATPELHRFHHSTNLQEAGNYGSELSIWDKAFNSFQYHPERSPQEIGVTKPHLFPAPSAIGLGILHPFKWFISSKGKRPNYSNIDKRTANRPKKVPSTTHDIG
ncbi:sterol desaturase family protein [Pseudoalteromonas piscicida]|uniref:Fatty acid hydroxylase domain-containing protein n=1 Tax=Pseudoalteromonas piscicida TaxID=43662 RepID=A0ABM6NCU4_PSEO7|nr:sterol desaturase family protein [Pseudoalteromonas piscicida]ATD06587.1 hypothetical protein PPIS_a1471 [Pseudoalteromonas piscicida]WPU33294.1 sterol desaturase family protein [Pseudoalteromonas piscicida]